MEFIVIDVELANQNPSSICQLGFVVYRDGKPIHEYSKLIDPDDDFSLRNFSIHGIDEDAVYGMPKFADVAPFIHPIFDGRICVSHGGVDRKAIEQAFKACNQEPPNCQWLNSATLVRRSWDQFKDKGYRLFNICEYLGIQYHPHDALEDAKATGQVVIRAIEKTGIGIEEWLVRLNEEKKTGDWGVSVSREGNSEGPMFGAEMVFTGLGKMKPAAADTAAKLGCKVHPRVTNKTTHLVVADEVSFFTQRAGRKISTKHELALKKIEGGQSIEILSVSEFTAICKRLG